MRRLREGFFNSAILLILFLSFALSACSSSGDKERNAASGNDEDREKVPIQMVQIQGGTFMMGSPTTEPDRYDEEVQHKVTVSAFSMSKYQVTQDQFESLMGYNPSSLTGTNLPVEWVTWYDAVEFCNKLSDKEGLEQVYAITNVSRDGNHITEATVTADWSKKGYRLPTEAEWEYACRADTTTPFNTGDNITAEQANYDGNYPYKENPKGIYREKTTRVGSFAPNAWDLCDMHGNVWEWCWDFYDSNYSSNASSDPKGSASGVYRVLRGGSWFSLGRYLRSANRSYFPPDYLYSNIGFRLARS
ncbi:MAG: formylglycine-generating enzyme family protein [Leptospirales bacterium]|nr:formylglycine-generating enzyme family protein [Leptospirales bacterium]